ncbi:MAG TPA: hypothetical protein VJO35_15865 [Terriglobales bacterium]|nr:hypothetical protein [Terriglobales bacterium]
MTVIKPERQFALLALRWSLGVVVLIEAVLFLFSAASHLAFASTHLPSGLRLVLGGGEVLGAILLAIPGAEAIGGRVLMFIFAVAIVTHLLHGMPNVGPLVIYFAAAWVLAST